MKNFTQDEGYNWEVILLDGLGRERGLERKQFSSLNTLTCDVRSPPSTQVHVNMWNVT